MPRQPLLKNSLFPYHVRARTNNGVYFPLPMQRCWEIFSYYLNLISTRYGSKIGSFVLMSNHFHLIIWTPDENLDEIMHYLLREVSKRINFEAKSTNHLFGSPYKWTIIDHENYLVNCYKYNCQNPVRAGLVENVEDYPYSTLYYLARNETTPFPLYEDLVMDYCFQTKSLKSKIDWLNIPYDQKQQRIIQLSLRKNVFSFPKHRQFQSCVKSLDVPKGMTYQMEPLIEYTK